LFFHNHVIVITFITEMYDPLSYVMLPLQVLLSSTTHIDKAFPYKFLWPWLGSGLLTSTGKETDQHSATVSKVIESDSATVNKVFEKQSSTVSKVIIMHSATFSNDIEPHSAVVNTMIAQHSVTVSKVVEL
jgi:hypothetical protein